MTVSDNKSMFFSPALPIPSAQRVRWGTNLRPTLFERKILLFLGDIFVVALACGGALWLWSFTRLEPLNLDFLKQNSNWMTALMIGWLSLSWLFDLYHFKLTTKPGQIFLRLGAVAAIILMGYLLIFFVKAYTIMLPRLPLLYALMLAFVGTNGWRWGYSKFVGQETFRQRLLIIGAGWAGQTLASAIQTEAQSHFQLLGFVDDQANGRSCEDANGRMGEVANELAPSHPRTLATSQLRIIGQTTDMLQLAHEYQADAIIYAIPNQLRAETFQLLLDCQAAGLSIIQMPALYETLTGRVPVEHVRNDWLLPIEVTGGRPDLIYYAFTRLVDWGFSFVAGLFFLIFGPIVALLIKLDSAGPIFYHQTRLGKGGQPFKLIKFRSMRTNAEQATGAKWATKNDTRVTRIGRFLRETRLDELPQILNILRGEIHLIGPRPERPEFVSKLEEEIPFYRARLVMKPGLTGWAQVKYRYGSTVEDALVKLQYDLYYIKNRSILLDLSILAKTVGVIVSFKGT